MSFYFGGREARVGFEAGGGEQLVLRVLGRALKSDRFGRSLLLRERVKRAEKKSGNQCSLFDHAAPRLANRGRRGQSYCLALPEGSIARSNAIRSGRCFTRWLVGRAALPLAG